MNKLVLLIFLAAFGATTATGQTSGAIPTSNAQWRETYITIAGPQTWYTVICGDTTIHQQTWSKMHIVNADTNLQVVWSIYRGALRSEGQKAWYIPAETTDSLLLYDFALEAGDTFELEQTGSGGVDKLVVDYTEELLIGGKLRKVIHFEPIPWTYEDELWMEGIGSNRGLLNRGSGQGPDYGTYLSCFRHNDELINFSQQPCEFPDIPECPFTNTTEPEFPLVKVFITPNPASSQVVVSVSESDTPEWDVRIHDVSGKLVEKRTTPLPLSINVSEWPAGAYLVSVKSTTKTTHAASRLFVVQH